MSSDTLVEPVPRLTRRAGDAILANENNSTLILGRDRQGKVDSGYGGKSGAAAIHLIVGRQAEDPSALKDSGTIYLSAKTDPDTLSGLDTIGTTSKEVSAAVLRADCIRIVPRMDLKISVGKAYMVMSSDGRIVLDGEIFLGEGASDRIIKGDAFSRFWNALTIPTPVGPSGPPPPLPPDVFSSRTVRVR